MAHENTKIEIYTSEMKPETMRCKKKKKGTESLSSYLMIM